MKKLAFVGTHGIGKTTLTHQTVAELKKRGVNAEFLGEIVRSCPLSINEETSQESQRWIIHSQIVKELEMKNKCDWLVCDRSIFDGYVYFFNKFGRDEVLEKLVLDYIKSYDLLFLVEINPNFLKKDGIRSVNVEFQKEIDVKIKELLEKFGISFVNFQDVDSVCELVKKNSFD
jgi:nicotinamide riboside kinase